MASIKLTNESVEAQVEILRGQENYLAWKRDLDEAEKMYSRALVGFEKAWGPDHRETLDTANKLGDVLCDHCYHATKSSTRRRLHFGSALLPDSSNHPQIIKVIDLCIRFPLCQPTLLAHLCRIFRWNGWDDLSVTASSYAISSSLPRYNALCDGCKRDLNINTSRHVCKSCKDLDLCSSCFNKYELDELKDVLKICQDHTFLELSKMILENDSSQAQLSAEEWLRELMNNLKLRERHTLEPFVASTHSPRWRFREVLNE
jgi:Zinc finger, ZZ type